MKKIVFTLLILCVFAFCLPFGKGSENAGFGTETEKACSGDKTAERTVEEFAATASLLNNEDTSFAKSAKSAYLIDSASGTVLFSRNENQRLTIASMTKIMLLNLAFEAVENGTMTVDEQYVVSERASSMGGSQVFLQANKPYKIDDLLKSIVIASANDASVAVAERLYGSEEACVNEMNARCGEWGLENTLFSNCTGLPKTTQYSCAKDVAIMMKRLISYKEYFKYSNIWLDKLVHPDGQETVLTNTNRLVNFYDGCDGGKTGYTDEAGFCVSATAKRGNLRMICVVIGEPTSKERFKEVREMLDYSFSAFTSKAILDSDTPLDVNVDVKKGKEKTVDVLPSEGYSAFMKRNEKCEYSYDFTPFDNVVAPIEKGDEIGEIVVYKGGVEVARIKAVAASSVQRKSFLDSVKEVIRNRSI